MNPPQIAIASTFTCDPVERPLRAWLRELKLDCEIEFAPFNQVQQNLIDPQSLLGRNRDGFNVLPISLSDWATQGIASCRSNADDFVQFLHGYCKRNACPTLVVLCPAYDASTAPDIAPHEDALRQEISALPNLTVLDSRQLEARYPVEPVCDPVTLRSGHIPYHQAWFTGLASSIARWLSSLQTPPSKVIALDCDNTLWKGVCGEVGADGVELTQSMLEFQQRLVRLHDQGFLLCLNSKNNEADVWNVFDANPQMPLTKKHIVASKINWEPKSQNLIRLAADLRLGLDSFIFLDDSPIEIAEVNARCPEVVALQLPDDELERRLRMDHLWPLDRYRTTSEDIARVTRYHQEAQRNAGRSETTTLNDFLRDLELKVDIHAASDAEYERLAQLTQRTNQFNASLHRMDASAVAHWQSGHECYAVSVTDKYGDYGLVGAIFAKTDGDDFLVDNLLLSCRALGRGVEHRMLKFVLEQATRRHLESVRVPFQQGPRNQPCRLFLDEMQSRLGGEARGQADEGDLTYVFSAAAHTQIDPFDIREDTIAGDRASPSANPSGSSLAREFQRIAVELNSVEAIATTLLSERQPRRDLQEPYVAARGPLRESLASICRDVLAIDRIGLRDALTDLGASSLQIVLIHSRIIHELEYDLSITELYTLPTIGAIADRLESKQSNSPSVKTAPTESFAPSDSQGIAVIGMAGRFPGADSVNELWQNLIDGVNCIVEIPDEQLNLPTDSPLRTNPNLVRKSASVRDVDKFDASFFGIFPKEAQVMDPQHRLLLECCWHAIEDAGYCPDAIDDPVGVFAGCYMDTYILASLASNPALLASLANSFHGGDLHTELGNDKDYLATRISFLLNLRGPSLTIQTACSTSLVAIIQACESLLSGQCRMALAGGSTLKLPQNRGYLYTEGGMVSPDGICRTFDANARGTVFGEGVGCVFLKRVEDAIADGDDIYGILKGWGINNDGRSKMGYTAPSIDGQSSAVVAAHRKAGISADSITYMEAHGTGTSLGDPIEVDALTKAFRESTDAKQYCAIGSVKSNIGHLDVAAGVTGLIKNCLALKHEVIPQTINFESPNPNIDFENSPFFVAEKPQPWPRGAQPRRAGLSSFGVGGTNAHVVVEEAPSVHPPPTASQPQVLVLSARSESALDIQTQQLAERLEQSPDLSISDVAYTLQMGRKRFNYTRITTARSVAQAVERLSAMDPQDVHSHREVRRDVGVTFLFPGQGSQHVNMCRELYEQESQFRGYVDHCCELLRENEGLDLLEHLFVQESQESVARVNQTTIAQPAIFVFSYAYAKWLQALGISPIRMVGHSVGEFVAATIASVFDLPDALSLIACRGRSMQDLPAGDMMAVRLSEPDVLRRLPDDVEIAAINGPEICVVSGPKDSVDQVQAILESDAVVCRRLHTSHAFHSAMMEPAVEPFRHKLQDIELCAPEIEIISSVTGKTLTAKEATDANYWARHLRETVRFTDAVHVPLEAQDSVLIEVGPGQTLSTLARQHPAKSKEQVVLSVSPHAKQTTSSVDHWWTTVGRLWQAGAHVDWQGMHGDQDLRRVHLPTYPFERKRFWFDQCEIAPTAASLGGVDLESATETIDQPVSDEPSPDQSVAATDPQQLDANQLELGQTENGQLVTCQPTPEQLANDEIARTVVQQQLEIMRQQLQAWRNY